MNEKNVTNNVKLQIAFTVRKVATSFQIKDKMK